MKLEKYKVSKFRSIEDSGWITVDDVAALIGENESGKTNALVPLWKLNPAIQDKFNELDLLKDYPRASYYEINSAGKDSELRKHRFIVAIFSLSENDLDEITKKLGVHFDASHLELSRDYNNEVHIRLLKNDSDCIATYDSELNSKLHLSITQISDEKIRVLLEGFYDTNKFTELGAELQKEEYASNDEVNLVISVFKKIKEFRAACTKIKDLIDIVPKFIYYSTYENLDADIYLPDVISNSAAYRKKSRTLNTLFKFVKLSPKEIFDLGQTQNNGNYSDEQKQEFQANTAKRQVLLESAANGFTEKFNSWWGQDVKYNFKFEADGNTFRIKVSDDRRPSYLELSSRSSGLQWFFSFFLVFLVESEGIHKNVILLLDEPGVTLHPNAQKQLYLFFDNLSHSNQVIYTTHSPFMINSNQLDKVYAVYVDDKGISCVTSDLRKSASNKKLNGSIYPAHAALGLSVSDTLLNGCYPVIVEGISDQIYFSLIKNALIKNGKLNTQKEIVFIPSDGVKGIKAILQILAGLQNEEYPYIILDGDNAGQELLKSLTQKNGLYCGKNERILSLKQLFNDAEVEDLIPFDTMKFVINGYLPKMPESDDTFDDVAKEGVPICDQINSYAESNSINLAVGYKVEIAERLKRRVIARSIDIYEKMTDTQRKVVDSIFEAILGVDKK